MQESLRRLEAINTEKAAERLRQQARQSPEAYVSATSTACVNSISKKLHPRLNEREGYGDKGGLHSGYSDSQTSLSSSSSSCSLSPFCYDAESVSPSPGSFLVRSGLSTAALTTTPEAAAAAAEAARYGNALDLLE